MSKSEILGLEEYQDLCKKILELSEIRFAGFLDRMGNLVTSDFRKDVTPLKDEAERKKYFMEAVLRVRTREEFDENIGPTLYAAARRTKVVMMTFTIGEKILFISADPHVDIDKTAKKIMKICGM